MFNAFNRMVRVLPVKSLAAAGLAACLALCGSADGATISLSTGLNTTVVGPDNVDNIWRVNLSPNDDLRTLNPGFPALPGVWTPDTGASKWLVPVAYGQDTAPPNTNFQYSTTFTVTAADITAGATLDGRYLSDDQAQSITLSGAAAANLSPLNSYGSSFNTWTNLSSYVFTTAGTYTLTFDIHNGPGESFNPTGFRFEGGYTSAVPEPASLVMGALSTLALGGLSWKRRVARLG